MPVRLSRLIGKKKGSRRSNSLRVGIVLDVIFSITLAILGLILLVTPITRMIQHLQNPSEFSWFTFAIQVGLGSLIFVFGIYKILKTVWLVGASAERRQVLVSLARDVELFNELGAEDNALPNVPQVFPQRFESGQQLKYRLARNRLERIRTWVAAGLTLGFVVVSTVLVVFSWDSIIDRRPNWLLIILTLIHLPATIVQVYLLGRQMLRHSVIGPTRIEISDLTLKPGSTAKVFLGQAGRLQMKRVDVELVCVEQATYHQGTDIRTEIRPVASHRLFRQRAVNLRAGKPLETEFDISLPSGSMHSFVSQNNMVQWKLVVTCLAQGWPKLERAFPVVVMPEGMPG